MMSLIRPGGAPLLVLCIALTVVTLVTTHRYRRRRGTATDRLTRVFRARELRKLDAHLDRVAIEELGRLASEVVRYVTGDVGHVVVVLDHPSHGIALELSDGCLLTLSGVTRLSRSLLRQHAANDKLRPAGVDCDGESYRLRLRGESGQEIRVHTRLVSVTP